MLLYPVNLNVRDRLCLVVGGGNVALRKVQSLLKFGAKIRVVSPEICAELDELVTQGAIEFFPRGYREGELEDAFLVYAASNNPEVQSLVAQEAKKYKVLLNSATDPESCDFQVPAHFRRGELQIAISTAGASPAVSKMLREKLESSFGDEYEYAICLLRLVRQRIVTETSVSAANKEILGKLLQADLIGCIGRRDRGGLQIILEENLPKTVDVQALLEEFDAVCTM